MNRYLLDFNTLLALLDPRHVFHEAAPHLGGARPGRSVSDVSSTRDKESEFRGGRGNAMRYGKWLGVARLWPRSPVEPLLVAAS
jgi:hypothetical protein